MSWGGLYWLPCTPYLASPGGPRPPGREVGLHQRLLGPAGGWELGDLFLGLQASARPWETGRPELRAVSPCGGERDPKQILVSEFCGVRRPRVGLGGTTARHPG